MKHPLQMLGLEIRKKEAAKQMQQMGELRRLTSKGISLSEASKVIDIDYQQAVSLMKLLEVKDETNR